MSGWLHRYERVVGSDTLRALEAIARRLQGHRIVMVNTTKTGGGVAEILHRLVVILNELGVPTTWEVMEGDDLFFGVTKKIHNALHGHSETLTAEDREIYEERTRHEARRLELDGDLILIHDPQPAGLVSLRRAPGQRWVWRCHIDLSSRDPDHWEFLRPSVCQYDASIFSAIEFVPPLPIPTYLVPPSIDPFSAKNREMEQEEVSSIMERLDLPRRGPWVTQISRFDRIKDPIGVIEAFRMVRARRRARLLLAGGGASDDPEGVQVLAEVRERAEKAKDVTVLELPPGSDVEVNALQRASTVVMQKSLREGFALTVSEALWKRRAVVASAVGGIPLQVLHERTGLLARSIEGAALQTIRLLDNSDLRHELGAEGHAHVRDNFLHTREVRDYLAVFTSLL
ncbi:MAG: glycosyltransferase [Candidatus Eisenbacteria bacterium]|uniref:Glycosyltransferase n=1 Tax=Eiseniibacteriota bacterium TaxID=2212470 RepID=A0A538T9P1_UNCEI|nr:MAG: glycosyltransferase [Candidatus Eisenbacteria bacterium]